MRREALAILSSGALVADRNFGNRCLLDIHGCRHGGDVPLLDAHRAEELLGHVADVFVENFVVKAVLRFTTSAGRAAFDRLPCGVSVRTTVDACDVVVVDARGREQPFDEHEWRSFHQDPAAVLHAKRWRLLEVSLTEHPADKGAIARAINDDARKVRRRMEAAQRQTVRDDWRDRSGLDPILARALDRQMVRYGA